MKRKLKSAINWWPAGVFLVVASLVALAVSRWFHMNFWLAAAITIVSLLVVGLSTLFDDGD
jgi:L-asparagine transporter-like permease